MFTITSLWLDVRESTLSHTVVTNFLGGAAAVVTIQIQNREGYVRSSIHICVTYHTRTLRLRLGGNVNVPIIVCYMISQTSMVILQQVSNKSFLIVLMVNGNKPTLIGSL